MPSLQRFFFFLFLFYVRDIILAGFCSYRCLLVCFVLLFHQHTVLKVRNDSSDTLRAPSLFSKGVQDKGLLLALADGLTHMWFRLMSTEYMDSLVKYGIKTQKIQDGGVQEGSFALHSTIVWKRFSNNFHRFSDFAQTRVLRVSAKAENWNDTDSVKKRDTE